MILLADADVVLPDRVLSPATVVVGWRPHHRRAARGARAVARRSALRSAPPHDCPRLCRCARARRRGDRLSRRCGRDPAHRVTAASFRRHRVLSDLGRLLARRSPDDAGRGAGGTIRAASGVVPRAAGASRKQFHQSAVPRRAAARVPALPAATGPDGGLHRRGDPGRDCGGAARRRDRHDRAGDRRRARRSSGR